MIELTKLNRLKKETFILNCDHIETIEERPDTTIRLSNGKHIVVKESSAEVISKVIAYKRSIYGIYR
ncbi:MAG: flagellar FlbD family protein [Anaerovoracaceae bacterium]|jgi:flagellar protein FlbD